MRPRRGNFLPAGDVFTGMKKTLVIGTEYHRGIRIDSIPVRGFAGLLFVFATMFMFLGASPAIRELLLICGPAGLIWAGILYYWHNQTRW